jgi:hypothetical protein
MTRWIEHVGVLHVHSLYSDGRGSIPEILAAAREAGCRHVVLSDHDCLAAAREGWAGTHDGVTLLIGCEITPRRQGHVLILHADRCEGYAAMHNRSTLDAVQAQGGSAIIAHPMGADLPHLRIRHKPWFDWDHPVVRGLEIWSYSHDWVHKVAWWKFPFAYSFWRRPQEQVHGPSAAILATWDRLGAARPMAGWGGLDAHAFRVGLTGWTVFPYAQMFRYLRNHLFVTEEALRADAAAALSDALLNGRGFTAHDALADSTGTRAEARLPDGRLLPPGETARFEAGTTLEFSLPRAAELTWIENGRARLRVRGDRLAARPAAPGVHRFEARLEGRPWVFTNPFYLRESH